MTFNVGDLVRLKGDRRYENQFFQAGTVGTVAAAVTTLDAYLVALGHDTTTRLVPADALEPVVREGGPLPKAKKTASPGLRFGQGDRVKLRQQREYDGVIYPKGSPGTVRAVLVTLAAYLVDFDADATDRIVPDAVLDPE